MRHPFVLLVLAAVAWAGPACAQSDAGPRSLVFMIGDGFGPATVTLAREAAGGALALDEILVGAVATRPARGRVTDSAAAATALATGVSTTNGAIAMDPDGRPLATLAEVAQDQGLAVGLVTTTTINHATPASFMTHARSRGMYQEIATQLVEARVDLLLGGGRSHFRPESAGGARDDGRDLLAEAAARGDRVMHDAAGLAELDGLPALGIFSDGQMAYEVDRDDTDQPALEDMTRTALELLSQDPDGFVLMVEGGRIDHAAHGNDPVGHLHDALAFDRAVAVALEFVRSHEDVLLVVTADHETGGLTLSRDVDGSAMYDYRVEPLLVATDTAGALATSILGGEDVEPALARAWGLSSLSAEERRGVMDARDSAKASILAVALGHVMSARTGLGWTTLGHTAVDVQLWAAGPGAGELAGQHTNDGLGRAVAELMGFDLVAATAELRGEGTR
jgi:alkaline phosphatase